MQRKTAVLLAASMALGLMIATAQAGSSVAEATSEKPLLLFGLWGFGDFQRKLCETEDGGKVVPVPKGHHVLASSGCSKEWPDGHNLEDYNTLIVQAEGSSTIEYGTGHDQKLMKWFVRWPGQTQDETIICTASDFLASDKEWVVPVDGKFEYRLPEGAVKSGKLTKIGFTLLEGSTYGDVRFRVWLARR